MVTLTAVPVSVSWSVTCRKSIGGQGSYHRGTVVRYVN